VVKFQLKTLSDVEIWYQVKISNIFACLENLKDSGDICRAWENMRGNTSILIKGNVGQYGQKQHKPQCYEECSKSADQRKQAKSEPY